MVAMHTALLRDAFPDKIKKDAAILRFDKIHRDLQGYRVHLRIQSAKPRQSGPFFDKSL